MSRVSGVALWRWRCAAAPTIWAGCLPLRDTRSAYRLMCRGYTDIVDADLSKYFDTIPHSDLLKSVARRIVDRHVLWLIKLWLKAPVEERDSDGTRCVPWDQLQASGEGVWRPLQAARKLEQAEFSGQNAARYPSSRPSKANAASKHATAAGDHAATAGLSKPAPAKSPMIFTAP